MEGEEAAGAAEVWGSGAEWRGVKKEELASPSAVAKAILGTASDLIWKAKIRLESNTNCLQNCLAAVLCMNAVATRV